MASIVFYLLDLGANRELLDDVLDDVAEGRLSAAEAA